MKKKGIEIKKLNNKGFELFDFKGVVGGFIGIVIYIIYKEINGYGWGLFEDLFGLWFIAFMPGAMFVGSLLKNKFY